jgi:hypothetical protein
MNDLLQRGPEILPGTPEYEWMSSVVAKVAEYADRPTHWNGKLYEQPGPVSGIYQPDGSMTISREYVLDPARPAFTPEHTATSNELSAAAGATHMAIFQARLSLSELGDGTVPGATPVGSLEDLALENALADRFTARYGGRIAEDLTDQPLSMLGQSPAFRAYTTATDRLMNSVGGVAGMGPEKLRDLVESTGRPQRFNAIADAALDSQLGELVPESHRDQLRQDLTGPLRRGLRGLAMTEMSKLTDPGSKQTWGERSAERTVHEFIGNLADVVDHYESWADENPGVEAPALPDSVRDKFLDREEKTQQIWADAGWPAQQPVAGREQAYYQQLPEQRYPDARRREIAELQRFLWEHTAPSQQGSTTVDASGQPNNVRQIGSRKQERGVE